MRHLGIELKRIWNEFAEIKQSIAELKAQSVTCGAVVSEDKQNVEALIAETAVEEVKEVTEESAGEYKEDLTELESLKLKAEAMGIKVHHKAKIESIQRAIDEKEKA